MYTVIFVGLNNALAYVMEFDEHRVYGVFGQIRWGVDRDDVLAYSKDKEGHEEHLCLIL
jgi:hypothetical protein